MEDVLNHGRGAGSVYKHRRSIPRFGGKAKSRMALTDRRMTGDRLRRRFHFESERGRISDEETRDLFSLVLRRPDSEEVFFQVGTYAGMPAVNEALAVYREVLKERGEWPMK